MPARRESPWFVNLPSAIHRSTRLCGGNTAAARSNPQQKKCTHARAQQQHQQAARPRPTPNNEIRQCQVPHHAHSHSPKEKNEKEWPFRDRFVRAVGALLPYRVQTINVGHPSPTPTQRTHR